MNRNWRRSPVEIAQLKNPIKFEGFFRIFQDFPTTTTTSSSTTMTTTKRIELEARNVSVKGFLTELQGRKHVNLGQ